MDSIDSFYNFMSRGNLQPARHTTSPVNTTTTTTTLLKELPTIRRAMTILTEERSPSDSPDQLTAATTTQHPEFLISQSHGAAVTTGSEAEASKVHGGEMLCLWKNNDSLAAESASTSTTIPHNQNHIYAFDGLDSMEAPKAHEPRAYAMLRFPDLNFCITTLQIMLGRDVEAAKLKAQVELTGHIPKPEDVPLIISQNGGIKRMIRSTYGSKGPTGEDSCPLLRIHPKHELGLEYYKMISKRHLKIYYSQHHEHWAATVLGINGVFILNDEGIEEYHLQQGKTVVLAHGCWLQISSVKFQFVLPDNSDECKQSDDLENISHDFEPVDSDAPMTDTEDEEADLAELAESYFDDDSEAEEATPASLDVESVEEGNEGDVQCEDDGGGQAELKPKPQKKRGPGRPPKNGIMSKREQQQVKKAAQLKAKKADEESKVRNKPGQVTIPAKPEKRKYTKRKHKDPGEDGGSSGDGKTTKVEKEKNKDADKKDRSPSPEMRLEDFTEEQLAKPNKNYLALIHEALSSSGRPMDLPMIYKAIVRAYPFYKFRQTTKGWQSSIRHNLLGHPAFQRVRKERKGWLWRVVDGVPLGKEKKPRHSEHSQEVGQYQQQPIYQAGQQPSMGAAQYYAQVAPPQYPGYNPHIAPGHPLKHNGYQCALPAQAPHIGKPSGSYSSPYAATIPPIPPSQQQTRLHPMPPMPPTQQMQQMQNVARVSSVAHQYPSQQSRVPPTPQQTTHPKNLAVDVAIEQFRKSLLQILRRNEPPVDQLLETVIQSAVDQIKGNGRVPGSEKKFFEDALVRYMEVVIDQLRGYRQNRHFQAAKSGLPPLNTSLITIPRPSLGRNVAERPQMQPSGTSLQHPLMIREDNSCNTANISHPEQQPATTWGQQPLPPQTHIAPPQAKTATKVNPELVSQGGSLSKLPDKHVAGSKRPDVDGEDKAEKKKIRLV